MRREGEGGEEREREEREERDWVRTLFSSILQVY